MGTVQRLDKVLQPAPEQAKAMRKELCAAMELAFLQFEYQGAQSDIISPQCALLVFWMIWGHLWKRSAEWLSAERMW